MNVINNKGRVIDVDTLQDITNETKREIDRLQEIVISNSFELLQFSK